MAEDHGGAGSIAVRPARAEDRDAALAFCARIWDGGDYIEHVWDAWLASSGGALLVAADTVSERPLGLVHVRMVSDDEAWLEGIRVDPDARRRGIGRLLTSAALAEARARGAVVARLMVMSTNSASQELVAGFGFAKVAEVVRYDAPAIALEAPAEDTEPSDDESATPAATEAPAGESEQAEREFEVAPGLRLSMPGADELETVWAWLERSSLRPLSGGLSFGDWSARALRQPEVGAALATGHVWLLEEWEAIQALAILEERPPDTAGTRGRLHVRYMDGASEGIGRLALVLREEAGLRGLESVALWLPSLLILRDAVAGAGYEADEPPIWVYARELQ
jgi:ribosomal protein S18 acetylase RimI-like enzyme